MATIGEILLSLKGDAKGFIDSVNQSIGSLSRLQDTAKKTAQEVSRSSEQMTKTVSGLTEGLSQRTFTGTTTGLQLWNGVLTESVRKLQDWREAAIRGGMSLDDFNKNLARNTNLAANWGAENPGYQFYQSLELVKKGLVEQGKALSTTQKGMTGLAAETILGVETQQNFSTALNNVSSKLWVVTMGLQQMGVALTAALTVPLVGIGTLAIKTFADWEQGTKNL